LEEIMNNRNLGRFVLVLAIILGISGCAQARRCPNSAEVESFIQRREFALAQVNRLRSPMAGTSYAGTSEGKLKASKSESAIIPPHDNVRSAVKDSGRYWSVQMPGTELEVALSDELVKTNNTIDIAHQLVRHYASDLIQAGWHPVGVSDGADPGRYWATYVLSDLGRGAPVPPKGGISEISHACTGDDLRRGGFRVQVAACVDTTSRRAHVTLCLVESLGC
jgi:hypothetical protein